MQVALFQFAPELHTEVQVFAFIEAARLVHLHSKQQKQCRKRRKRSRMSPVFSRYLKYKTLQENQKFASYFFQSDEAKLKWSHEKSIYINQSWHKEMLESLTWFCHKAVRSRPFARSLAECRAQLDHLASTFTMKLQLFLRALEESGNHRWCERHVERLSIWIRYVEHATWM